MFLVYEKGGVVGIGDLTQTESESWFAENKKIIFFVFFHFFCLQLYLRCVTKPLCQRGWENFTSKSLRYKT
jgi:hypothetical protein